MSRFLVLMSVFIFTGCSIVPDSIDVPEGTTLVGYSKAVTSGAAIKGEQARWGGVIVGVQNKQDKTFIEVAHFPLNHYGKPIINGETIGRFKAQINGFIDPIVFEEGRAATFLGQVIQPTTGMVGEQPYMYPTISVDDYHMWRKKEVYEMDGFFFDYHAGWYSPFYRFNNSFAFPNFYGPWGARGFGRTRIVRYPDTPGKVKIPPRTTSPTRDAKEAEPNDEDKSQ
ncbi:starvation-inducible protein [Alteromonas sp. V450]|uniref:Slp family lipoprotein n=1 Tax=Alteromonas sp. V450 TaxID=1912139 RepID=UPI0008FF5C60|nr:Slp family lipoprotein [Alteromonas sp. V450]OJF68592.1 starvation-inducible protein [Alteromonas sp. V450]